MHWACWLFGHKFPERKTIPATTIFKRVDCERAKCDYAADVSRLRELTIEQRERLGLP